MIKPWFFLLILALLIVPVSATYTLTGNRTGDVSPNQTDVFTGITDLDKDYSTSGNAIVQVKFEYPVNTQINFTLYYGNAQMLSGYCYYADAGLFQQYSDIGLGTGHFGYTFVGASFIQRLTLSSYAVNNTQPPQSGIALYDRGMLGYVDVLNPQIVFYAIDNIDHNLIYRIRVHSNQPVTVTIYYDLYQNAVSQATSTPTNLAGEIAGYVYQLVVAIPSFIATFFMLLYWMKLIFIDNAYLTGSNLVIGGLAYAANTSRNIYEFWQKLFGVVEKTITFVTTTWERLGALVSVILANLQSIAIGAAILAAILLVVTAIQNLPHI